MKVLPPFAVFMLILSYGAAQQGLLFHKNRYREAIYYVGEEITFRLKGDKTKYTMLIRGFEDSVILFKDYRINPAEITHMYVDNKTKIWYVLRYKWSKLLIGLGGTYLLLDLLNEREFASEVLLVSGSFIVPGIITHFMISRKMKIKGRRRLAIITIG